MNATDELVIEAGRTERNYWRDLFRYRELFYFLSWRDLLVRYKQTVIGVLWAVLRPVLTTAVFVFVLGGRAKLHAAGGAPPGARLRRHVAVAILCLGADGGQREPGGECQHDLQDLLSAAYHSGEC